MKALQYAQNASDLLALPESCIRLRELMDSKTASLDDIAEVISLDPILTAKLLKLANSALYNFSFQVPSINKALLVVGQNQVYNLALSIGVAAAYCKLDTSVIDLERFWEQSVNAALIGKYLADCCGVKPSESFYVAGLLHNIGELVVLQNDPELAFRCQAYDSETLPWKLQHDELGFTYAECGAELLNIWQLPDIIVEPIALQNSVKFDHNRLPQLIIHLAVKLALANQHPELYQTKHLIDPLVLELLNLSQSDVLKAIDFCNTEGLFLLSVLNPRISTIY
ncbi:HDOD domain-containing protein [Rheinheimera sp. WS51]|uniref:HDOD domain-containing protein n=1 Tax=Rheinheimera sp. WS51 TaxID=3425886 RepID=UPI003D89FE4B